MLSQTAFIGAVATMPSFGLASVEEMDPLPPERRRTIWWEVSMKLGCWLATSMAAVAISTAVAAAGDVADSEAASVTADAVRAQGFPCTEPVSAQRDTAASRPDEAVWILVCSDARYRVRLRGDVPAEVERLQ